MVKEQFTKLEWQESPYNNNFLNLNFKIFNVNNNCATGSTAIYMAHELIKGGRASCALALGFDKMEPGSLGMKYHDRTNPLDKIFNSTLEIL